MTSPQNHISLDMRQDTPFHRDLDLLSLEYRNRAWYSRWHPIRPSKTFPQDYIFVGTMRMDTHYRLCQVHLKFWKFLSHVEIYKMRENFKTYQWMKCSILATYIHSHHLLLNNSSCPCRMKQDNELGIHIHCYQEGLAIKKISSCQIKQSLKLS
jgi:hypothetical protein